MSTLRYFTSINIWLHLEDYYRAGLTPEQAKEIIEKIVDPFSACQTLTCEPSMLNRNWIVHSRCRNDQQAQELAELIDRNIRIFLKMPFRSFEDEAYSRYDNSNA
jgi:hypothetical protein